MVSHWSFAAVPIFGSVMPAQRTIGPGYLLASTFGSAGNGVGIGEMQSYDGNAYHTRTYRFTASGSQILAGLGVSVSGKEDTFAYDTNASGVAVGRSMKFTAAGASRGSRPVRWNAESGAVVELGMLGENSVIGTIGDAWAINDRGTTVGRVQKYTGGFGFRPIRWDADSTTPIELGVISLTPNNSHDGAALAINEAGTTVGYGEVYKPGTSDSLGTRAVRWSAGTTAATQLGTLGTDANGKTTAYAVHLNAANTTIGFANKYDSAGKQIGIRGIRWAADSVDGVELLSIGTRADGFGYSKGFDQNDAGVVVGQTDRYDVNGTFRGRRAVRWAADSNVAVELGTFGERYDGIASGFAIHINAAGNSVGRTSVYNSFGASQGDTAVLWNAAGVPTNLNTLLPANSGWKLVEANDITDTGWISGTGTFDPDGPGGVAPFGRAFIMLVPQAGTYGLGDANFDGSVNFDDLIILAQHYNQPNAALATSVGDLNLDGQINFDDLIPLAQNYNRSFSPATLSGDAAFAADWALAQSLVPEPAGVVGVVAATWLTRRPRRRA